MSRLDDIPKKDFFQVPDGYFEKLPSDIQMRVAPKRRSFVAIRVLRYALPVVLIAVALFLYRSGTPTSAEEILASVDPLELIDYLQETGMSTDEILEAVELTPEEVDALEKEVYVDTYDINSEYKDHEK